MAQTAGELATGSPVRSNLRELLISLALAILAVLCAALAGGFWLVFLPLH